jgi:hypothetical protein
MIRAHDHRFQHAILGQWCFALSVCLHLYRHTSVVDVCSVHHEWDFFFFFLSTFGSSLYTLKE